VAGQEGRSAGGRWRQSHKELILRLSQADEPGKDKIRLNKEQVDDSLSLYNRGSQIQIFVKFKFYRWQL